MKRLQIYIEEELDDALALEARRKKTSKAALIRSFVAAALGAGRRPGDAVAEIIGRYDYESGSVDDVVYREP